MQIGGLQNKADTIREAELLEAVAREQEDVALYGLMLAEAAMLRDQAEAKAASSMRGRWLG